MTSKKTEPISIGSSDQTRPVNNGKRLANRSYCIETLTVAFLVTSEGVHRVNGGVNLMLLIVAKLAPHPSLLVSFSSKRQVVSKWVNNGKQTAQKYFGQFYRVSAWVRCRFGYRFRLKAAMCLESRYING